MLKIGIRREDKNEWERRVPLVPDHVKALTGQGVQVIVQPSKIRVFRDDEFTAAGATVQEDLSGCDLVFGIKEFPEKSFREAQSCMFFAHVIKGQKQNMPMLKKMMDLHCTLLDYEKVTDDENRRLIFFGNFAGLAGMIETLYALGKRLEWEGTRTPFLGLHRPLRYRTLGEARAAMEVVGEWIASEGIPEALSPMVFGFAGYGNVSKGAQEMFDLLPHENIAPEDLASFMKSTRFSRRKLYKVVFAEKDMVVPADRKAKFELQEYYEHPEKYRGIFEQYLPHLTVLVNGIYWEARYPRLVTKKWVKEAWAAGKKPRLRVIGDISCDVEGSVECTVRPTEPDRPCYVFSPAGGGTTDGFEGNGPVIMAVEILPTELPRESSMFFGDLLMRYIPEMVKADLSRDFPELALPAPIKRSVIVHKGALTPDYTYIAKFLAPE
jgi:saccharopine dehydrogenase (NAD+, L-lysine-forming)